MPEVASYTPEEAQAKLLALTRPDAGIAAPRAPTAPTQKNTVTPPPVTTAALRPPAPPEPPKAPPPDLPSPTVSGLTNAKARVAEINKIGADAYAKKYSLPGSVQEPQSSSSDPQDVRSRITAEAQRQGLDPNIALAIAKQETGFKHKVNGRVVLGPLTRNGYHAHGLFQLMPYRFPNINIDDEGANTTAGIGLLKELSNKYNGNLNLIAGEYFGGPGAIGKHGEILDSSPLTQQYARDVQGKFASIHQDASGPQQPQSDLAKAKARVMEINQIGASAYAKKYSLSEPAAEQSESQEPSEQGVPNPLTSPLQFFGWLDEKWMQGARWTSNKLFQNDLTDRAAIEEQSKNPNLSPADREFFVYQLHVFDVNMRAEDDEMNMHWGSKTESEREAYKFRRGWDTRSLAGKAVWEATAEVFNPSNMAIMAATAGGSVIAEAVGAVRPVLGRALKVGLLGANTAFALKLSAGQIQGAYEAYQKNDLPGVIENAGMVAGTLLAVGAGAYEGKQKNRAAREQATRDKTLFVAEVLKAVQDHPGLQEELNKQGVPIPQLTKEQLQAAIDHIHKVNADIKKREGERNTKLKKMADQGVSPAPAAPSDEDLADPRKRLAGTPPPELQPGHVKSLLTAAPGMTEEQVREQIATPTRQRQLQPTPEIPIESLNDRDSRLLDSSAYGQWLDHHIAKAAGDMARMLKLVEITTQRHEYELAYHLTEEIQSKIKTDAEPTVASKEQALKLERYQRLLKWHMSEPSVAPIETNFVSMTAEERAVKRQEYAEEEGRAILVREREARITALEDQKKRVQDEIAAFRERATKVQDQRRVGPAPSPEQLEFDAVGQELERIAHSNMHVDADEMESQLRQGKSTPLSADEKHFTELQKKRKQLLDLLDPQKPQKPLFEHVALEAELTEREQALREIEARLAYEATHATTPEEAIEKGQRAEEARKLAAQLKADRDKTEAERLASRAKQQEFPRGEPIAVHVGMPVTLTLASGQEVSGHWAVVRGGEVIASHDPFTFHRNDRFIHQDLNPINYEDENFHEAREIVKSRGKNPDLDEIHNTRETNAAPVLSPDGQVLGNTATFLEAMRIHSQKGQSEAIAADLLRKAYQFGLDPDAIPHATDKPVLVFMLDERPTDLGGLMELTSGLLRPEDITMTEAEQGVQSGYRVSGDTLNWVSEAFKGMGDQAFVRNLPPVQAAELVDRMIKDGVIGQAERGAYINEDGELTPKAIQVVENALMGKVIPDANALAGMPRGVFIRLSQAMAPLLKMRLEAPIWNIGDYLHQAIRNWTRIEKMGDTLDGYGQSGDSKSTLWYNYQNSKLIPGEADHPIVEALTKLLEESPKTIEKALSGYIGEVDGKQTGWQFEPGMEPAESFNWHIANDMGVEVKASEWGTLEPAYEEPKPEAKSKARGKIKAAKGKKAEAPKAAEPEKPSPTGPTMADVDTKLRGMSEEDLDREYEHGAAADGTDDPYVVAVGKELRRRQTEPVVQPEKPPVSPMEPTPEEKAKEDFTKEVQEVIRVNGPITRDQFVDILTRHPNFSMGKATDLVTFVEKGVRRVWNMSLDEYLAQAFGAVELMGEGPKSPVEEEVSVLGQLGKKKGMAPTPKASVDGPKGAVEFLADGRAILHLMEHGDVSTFLHEWAHVAHRNLMGEDRVAVDKWGAQLRKEWNPKKDPAYTRWLEGAEDSHEKRVSYLAVYVQEKFARAFERFVHDGIAPNEEIRPVFERLRDWMREVYENVSMQGSSLDVKIPADIRRLFERMAGGTPEDLEVPGEKAGAGTALMSQTPSAIQTLTKEQQRVLDKYLSVVKWDSKGEKIDTWKKKLTSKERDILYTIPYDAQPLEAFGPRVRDIIQWERDHPEHEKAMQGKSGVDAAVKAFEEHPVHFKNNPNVNHFTESQINELISKLSPAAVKRWADSEKVTPEGLTRRVKEMRRNVASLGVALRSEGDWADVPLEALRARSMVDEMFPLGKRESLDDGMTIEADLEESRPDRTILSRSIKDDERRTQERKEEEGETLTPEQRMDATEIFNHGESFSDSLDTARFRVFSDAEKAVIWARENASKTTGLKIYNLEDRSGKAFVHYAPRDPSVLFQETEPGEVERRLRAIEERLRNVGLGEQEAKRLAKMRDDLKAQQRRAGTSPDPKPGRIVKLFGPHGEELKLGGRDEEAKPGRTVSDVPAPLQDPRSPRRADEQPRDPRGTEKDRAAVGPVRGTGEGGRAGHEDERPGETLRTVQPARVDTPTKPRGTEVYDPAQWSETIETLGMPANTPPPTVRIPMWLRRMLKFPAQPEMVEAGLSGIKQHDAVVLAAPTGGGKTYMMAAMANQLVKPDMKVLVMTINKSLIRKRGDGLISVFRDFAVPLEELKSGVSDPGKPGVYAVTYSTSVSRKEIRKAKWDLIICDEIGVARNPYSETGIMMKELAGNSKKAIYISATPFHNALELYHMDKLGLWRETGFDAWGKQFGIFKDTDGKYGGSASDSLKLIKLRSQLIERGQFVSVLKNMEGFNISLAQVPLTPDQEVILANIKKGFDAAADHYTKLGPSGTALLAATRKNAATFTKKWLERIRLPQAIEMAKEMQKQGWKVAFFSETKASREDIFSFLQPANFALDGKIRALLPDLPDVPEGLFAAFGEDLANYSGPDSSHRTAELDAFNSNEKKHIYLSFAAGGMGLNAQDKMGTQPRAVIFLGPPYSGMMLEQGLGRFWRFGTKSNVHAIFMTSNAEAELNMLVSKIAPRMSSLRALVNGINNEDKFVNTLHAMRTTEQEQAAYELGNSIKFSPSEFRPIQTQAVQSWKDVKIGPAKEAMNKGLKMPDTGGPPKVGKLFQESEPPKPPEDLSIPKNTEARAEHDRQKKDIVDGKPMPGVPAGIENAPQAIRERIAEVAGVEAKAAEDGAEDSEEKVAAVQSAYKAVRSRFASLSHALGESDASVAYKAFLANLFISGHRNILNVTREAGIPQIGEKIVRWARQYEARKGQVEGQFLPRLQKIHMENGISPQRTIEIADKTTRKMKKVSEYEAMVMAIEGKAPPANARIAKAATQIAELLKDMHKLAADTGVVVERYVNGALKHVKFSEFPSDPTYFPHIFDPDYVIRDYVDPTTGKKSDITLRELLKGKPGEARWNAMIDRIAKEKGVKRSEVEDYFKQHTRDHPLAGNVERSREQDLGFYLTTPEAMLKYIEEYSETIARTELFGQQRQKLNRIVSDIPNQGAREVTTEIMDALLSQRIMSHEERAIMKVAANEAVITTMTTSSIKAMTHSVWAALHTNTRAFLTSLGRAALWDRKLARSLFQGSGAGAEHYRNGLLDSYGASKGTLASGFLKFTGFHKAFNFARLVVDGSARHFMEVTALPKLMKGGKGAEYYRRALKETFLFEDGQIDKAIAAGSWSADELNWGAKALVDRTTYSHSPLELPPAWRSTAGTPAAGVGLAVLRQSTLLKGYTYKTCTMLTDRLYREARKGNWRPWIPFLTLVPALGSAIVGANQLLRTALGAPAPENDEESGPWSEIKHYAENIGHMMGIAIVFNILDRKEKDENYQPLGDISEYIAGKPAMDTYRTLVGMPLGIAYAKDAKTSRGRTAEEKRWKIAGDYVGDVYPLVRPFVKTLEPEPRRKSHRYQMTPTPRE